MLLLFSPAIHICTVTLHYPWAIEELLIHHKKRLLLQVMAYPRLIKSGANQILSSSTFSCCNLTPQSWHMKKIVIKLYIVWNDKTVPPHHRKLTFFTILKFFVEHYIYWFQEWIPRRLQACLISAIKTGKSCSNSSRMSSKKRSSKRVLFPPSLLPFPFCIKPYQFLYVQ